MEKHSANAMEICAADAYVMPTHTIIKSKNKNAASITNCQLRKTCKLDPLNEDTLNPWGETRTTGRSKAMG